MRAAEFVSLAFCHHHDPNLYFNLAAPSAGKTSLWKIKSNLFFVSWSGYFYKNLFVRLYLLSRVRSSVLTR